MHELFPCGRENEEKKTESAALTRRAFGSFGSYSFSSR